MGKYTNWISTWTTITTIVVWVLANMLDIASVFFTMQLGKEFAILSYHPGEVFFMYAIMRSLIVLGFCLLIAFVSKHWPDRARLLWGMLTIGAMFTAVLAWVRVYSQ